MARALALLVLALAVAAAGCGGDNGDEGQASATEWANGLCSAVSTWADELQAAGGDITESPSEEGLEAAASAVRDATDDFVAELRALGTPETEAGDEARAAVEQLADEVEAERREIEDAIEDASGIAGITAAVSEVAASLTAMGERFEETFRRLEDEDPSGELRQAFEDAESCDELVSE